MSIDKITPPIPSSYSAVKTRKVIATPDPRIAGPMPTLKAPPAPHYVNIKPDIEQKLDSLIESQELTHKALLAIMDELSIIKARLHGT